MAKNYLSKTSEIIDGIVAVDKKSSTLNKFIRIFYQHVSSDLLANYDNTKLFKAAESIFKFISERKPDQRKVRVYNPTKKEHGFETNHTILEINQRDMPFLIDSVTAELGKYNYNIQQVIHPVVEATRDAKGNLKDISEYNGDKSLFRDKDSPLESVMHFRISHIESEKEKNELIKNIENVLEYAALAVADWKKMTAKLAETLAELEKAKLPVEKSQVEEVKEFLGWLGKNNFTFLGYIDYDFVSGKKPGEVILETVKNSELGIFRSKDSALKPTGLSSLSKEALAAKKQRPILITITKSNRKSAVHRPVHMDYIGIKKFNSKGEVIGEKIFLGLFTSAVYYQSTALIPIIRQKLAATIKKSGFKRDGHNGKTLATVLETYPRDELLQIADEDLFENCMGIVELSKRPRVRLFVRKDNFKRFVSCIVFIPRERFNTGLREKIQKILEDEFGGFATDHYTQVTDAPLARLHVVIKTTPETIKDANIEKVEKILVENANSWFDGLKQKLLEKMGEKNGDRLVRNYSKAFHESFTNRYNFGSTVCDIIKIEEAIELADVTVDLYRLRKDEKNIYQLKIYHPEKQIMLSDILPTLENMGFHVIDETSFDVRPAGYAKTGWIHHFSLRDNFQSDSVEQISFEKIKAEFEEALLKVIAAKIENDAFNKLIIRTGMNWRDVKCLRAFSKYIAQTGFTYSFNIMAESIAKHAGLSVTLRDIFYSRFALGKDDAATRDKKIAALYAKLEQYLANVSNVAEDRIIRRFADVMLAALRTNFFQKNAEGKDKDYISFKFDSLKVPELPLPKPYAEIFVYSYQMEGVHLRGGKVARGGLRWSDRNEDFRTEILGLMKAQMVKNAVIVPVGSKGGFVLKNHNITSRDELLKYGIECYKTFLRGLLDLTDNISGNKVMPPKDVVRHDGDDTYLVVAADKGTATFSDIANSVSAEYNFWLGDAFASGGSAGYDHKKMAITARGGWVSVVRHFSELGVNIDKEEFTAVGVGDMAGDVFGNGMLLSNNLRLLAAFNHMHIFLDPTPDAKKSFEERKRLFNLPRSSWTDYDAKLISKGGGIFERKAKQIKLTAEVKKALNINADSLTPDDLIKAILKSPVDLLWNGGIGTYVKATTESNEQVGDKTNDVLRINGKDLRCKIIGEGGNLGFTQLGRIEYAMQGGRINTDAIDNSAGVDCSDHEVNIKIAFSKPVEKKTLTIKERDKLLEKMTDEVAALVLRDNFLQTQAISISEQNARSILEQQARLMTRLEKAGLLDRKIEFLPDDEELAKRMQEKKALTRPEIAVLLAYSKIALYNDLVASDLPDDEYFVRDLNLYFPELMREKYTKELAAHPLKREIIATFVTNSMINRVGSTFNQNMADDTGLSNADIARAYTVARDSFDMRPLWREIEALTVDAKTKYELFNQVTSLIERVTAWFLHNEPNPLKVKQLVEKYKPGIAEVAAKLEKLTANVVKKGVEEKLAKYLEAGVPEKLAKKIAYFELLTSACDIVKAADKDKLSIMVAGEIYFALQTRLGLGWLRYHVARLPTDTHWQRLAVKSMIDDMFGWQARLVSGVIKTSCNDEKCETAIQAWEKENSKELALYDAFMADLKTYNHIDQSMIVVGLRHLERIS